MKWVDGVSVSDVAEFYDGPSGATVRLAMGEQPHIGGLDATLELAELAGVGAGQAGVDLCCCMGGGMRALVRFRGVESMVGVDISHAMVEAGEASCAGEGMELQIRFILGDACASGLQDAAFDFAWSEDAWIYVPDKARVVAEAVRLVKPGGTVAFSDWVEGPAGLTDDEAATVLPSMHFPSIASLDDYRSILERLGCDVVVAEHTNRFGDFAAEAAAMLSGQHKYDALAIVDFDTDRLDATVAGFGWLGELGHAGKLEQARFVASTPANNEGPET